MKNHLQLSEEVQQAQASGQALVALESTIISHGMPYPQNVDTARELEHIIRCLLYTSNGTNRSVF